MAQWVSSFDIYIQAVTSAWVQVAQVTMLRTCLLKFDVVFFSTLANKQTKPSDHITTTQEHLESAYLPQGATPLILIISIMIKNPLK